MTVSVSHISSLDIGIPCFAFRPGSTADLHVRARRVLDRLELAAADFARRHGFALLAPEPFEPVRPPRAGTFDGFRLPGIDVGALRLAAGPVLVFRLARRVDH